MRRAAARCESEKIKFGKQLPYKTLPISGIIKMVCSNFADHCRMDESCKKQQQQAILSVTNLAFFLKVFGT